MVPFHHLDFDKNYGFLRVTNCEDIYHFQYPIPYRPNHQSSYFCLLNFKNFNADNSGQKTKKNIVVSGFFGLDFLSGFFGFDFLVLTFWSGFFGLDFLVWIFWSGFLGLEFWSRNDASSQNLNSKKISPTTT